MPFTKIGTNEYKSPSGRKFTTKQVKMYYATNGFTKKKKLPNKKELLTEHKELVKVLKSGSKSQRSREASKQEKEMKNYKPKIKVNNKMKGAYGRMNTETNKIEVNLKAHKKKGKLDKVGLASTIKHEMLHVKHPKMTEREVYKKSAKTKISPSEQMKLMSKLKTKQLNYKSGALKRKFKMKRDEKIVPGTFISKANESKRNLAIKGLI